MRIIKTAALVAFFSSVVLLAGCASTQGADHAAASFSATAGKICAVVQPTFASVNAEASLLSPPLDAGQQANLAKASGVVDTFCSTSTAATSQSAQGMLNTVFPVVMGIVANSSLNASSRNALLLSLVGVQTAANVLIAQTQSAPVAAK